MTEVQKSILKTLIYFDQFNCALTIEQMRKNLIGSQTSVENLKKELGDLLENGVIISKNDNFALKNREYLFSLKDKYELISRKKIGILKKALFVLKFIPLVRGVILFGSLAMKNANELSDIDLMIVCKKNYVWTTRLICKIFMIIIGIDRHKNLNHAPDKICLNHFISEDCLEIPFQNIYNAMMYRNGIALIDKGLNLKNSFLKNNNWIYSLVFKKPHGINTSSKLPVIEKIAKFIQTKIMSEKAISIANSKEVRICDQYLAFHDTNRESEFIASFERLIHNLKY